MGYLTAAEYVGAPTGVGIADLSYGGSSAVQTAELVRIIARASTWMDTTVNCILGAHTATRNQRVRVNRYGEIRLHPREIEPVSLTSLSYGWAANALTAVTPLTGAYIDEQDFVVPWPGVGSFGPQIQFAPSSGMPVLAVFTYVAGWPNTTLAATATAGAVALTVVSTVGMVVGQTLTIVDADKTEQVAVTAITSATVVAVTATANLHTFAAGALAAIAVHAMPEDLKEAAILATSGFIKARGNDAMVMNNSLAPGPTQGDDPTSSADLRLARSILVPNYMVIR